MKKFIKWALLICIPLASAYAYTTTWVGSLTDGYHIGTAATQRLGFFGAVPTMQPANSVSAYNALVTEGLIAAGGVDPSVPLQLNHVQVALTAAQIFALYDTPVQLVAAQGTGKSIIVSKVAFTIVRTSTAFTSGGVVIAQYANTVHGGGTQALDSTLAATVITGSAGTSVSFRNGAVVSDAASTVTQNVGLFISAQTADFASGTGTATVDVWWYSY